jgi:hypothetical protein
MDGDDVRVDDRNAGRVGDEPGEVAGGDALGADERGESEDEQRDKGPAEQGAAGDAHEILRHLAEAAAPDDVARPRTLERYAPTATRQYTALRTRRLAVLKLAVDICRNNVRYYIVVMTEWCRPHG